MQWTVRLRRARQSLKLSLLFFFLAASPAVAASPQYCAARFAELAPFEYPASVHGLGPDVPHTIRNMAKFLREKLGGEVVDAATRGNSRFLVIHGPGKKPLDYFRPGEIEAVREISNSFGAFNVVEVRLKNGTSTFLFSNINGQSREVQILSLLKLAGIESGRIQVLGRSVNYKHLYLRTFRKIGHKPDLVVFGFANTALEGILEKAGTPEARKMLALNQAYAEQKWVKPQFDQHELEFMGVQVLETSSGRRIWFIDNEYGDRAGWLMEALNEVGAKRTVFFGTAGSLNQRFKVGDMVSPRDFIRPEGTRVKSAARSKLTLSGAHGDVESPSLETLGWVADQARKGVDYVDVELQKVTPHLKPQADFSAYLVISDEINTTHVKDYTLWGEAERQQAKNKIKQVLMEHLKDAGMPPSDFPARFQVQYFDVKAGGAP